MAGRQVIHENGNVHAIVQWVLTVSAPLTVAAIIGAVVVLNDLKDAVNDLKTQVTITNVNYQAAQREHTTLSERISRLERQRNSTRDDSRDE